MTKCDSISYDFINRIAQYEMFWQKSIEDMR